MKSCSKETKELKEIFRNFGLTQLIDKSTRSTEESSTLLDLFASNSPGNITFTNVVASSLSGHDMLIAVRKINACKLPTSTIEWRNYAKYNPSAFCDDLRDIPWDDVLKERNVNTAWSNWKELFLNVCDRHAPYKRKIVRGVKCPWLTGETKKLMNQRDFFLRKARRSGAEVDWNAYRRLRNQVSNKIRNEKRRYHRNEIQENLNSPKAFWKAIKKVFPSKKGNSACQDRGGTYNNNNELYLHDQTNTYSIAKAMFRNQYYNTGQLRYFDNNLSRTSKQAEIYFMNCILIK